MICVITDHPFLLQFMIYIFQGRYIPSLHDDLYYLYDLYDL